MPNAQKACCERSEANPKMTEPRKEFKILVVCTGNSCRSPLAAALLRLELAGLAVKVESAGIAAQPGAPASALAQQAGAELGVDISNHQAQAVDPEMLNRADLILVMESGHRDRLIQLAPAAGPKIKLLGGYPDREIEIADPLGKSIEFYRQTALLLKAGVLRVVREIRARMQQDL
ncbi:MAG: low molecular weight protein arginine phosphatase [candidate division WOR-3 bacterium]|jgi:protein-tyrosine-phosphatase